MTLAILSAISLHCGIFEPIQEANYRDKGKKIRSGDAKLLIATEFVALMQRCPSDQSSLALYLNVVMNASTCSSSWSQENGTPPHENHHPDPITGCADARYLNRNEIDGCIYAIRFAPCNFGFFLAAMCTNAFGPATLNRFAIP